MLGTKLRFSTRTVCSLNLPKAEPSSSPHLASSPVPHEVPGAVTGPQACKAGGYFVTRHLPSLGVQLVDTAI